MILPHHNHRMLLIRAVFIVVLMTPWASALSQSPAGGDSQANRPVEPPTQAEALSPDQPAAKEQQGTEERPLIVKIAEPPEDASQTQRDNEEKDKKSHNESVITWSTAAIAGLTFVAVIIAGIQAWFFRRQLGLMRQSSDHTRLAAEAATRSSAIALDAFMATNRPKLRIRKMRLHRLQDGKPVVVTYELANIGNSPAIVADSSINVSFQKGAAEILYPRPDDIDIGAGKQPEGQVIMPGQSGLGIVTTSLLYRSELNFAETGDARLHINGYIRYKDAAEIYRQTSFQRRYDAARKRYAKEENPDQEYEYED